MNLFKGSTLFSRNFTKISSVSKEWKTIVSRRTAKLELPEVGSKLPPGLHIPGKAPEFPEYKYGESRIFKRSNKGLFGGQFIKFGNQISEKSKIKTRRSWLPNIQKKKLWSETLEKNISIKVTTRVLKTITKEGGIDNYLTKDKSARIKELGPTGWKLRFRIMMKRINDKAKLQKEKEQQQLAEKGIKPGPEVLYSVGEHEIVVGKRKLLKTLYGLHLENNTKLSHKEFMQLYKDESIEKIVGDLKTFHYDISQVCK